MFSSMRKKIFNKLMHWLAYEPKAKNDSPPCDFNRIKYEIRPGDVLLVEGRSRFSSVIRTITQSSWTHSALYIGRLHDIDDPNLRKKVALHMEKRGNFRLVIESLEGKGIGVAPIKKYKNHHIRICRPIGLTPEDAEIVVSYAIRSLGKPYNIRQFLDLGRYLLPWSILPRRWGSSLFKTTSGEQPSAVCSTLIAEAFTQVKFPILPFLKLDQEKNLELIQRNPHLFTPKDFDYSPYFEIIKYPLFDPNAPLPYYRRLPWSKKEGLVHEDKGVIRDTTETTKKAKAPTESTYEKGKKIIGNILHRSENKDKEQEDNISKPETD